MTLWLSLYNTGMISIAHIFGIYNYNGERIFRIKSETVDVYVNDDFKEIKVENTNDLQTVKVRINGELVCPWSQIHAS